jgi:hypothetical protein
MDKQVAINSLSRPAYSAFRHDPFLLSPAQQLPTTAESVAAKLKSPVGKSKLGEEI